PIGLGARDTLRLEMGYNLYGNDIDDTTSPIEANLLWITKFENKEKLIDRDFLMHQVQNGIKKRLTAFVMTENAIPRHGYSVYNQSKELIGTITSGTYSPMLSYGIGMAYIPIEFSKPDTPIFIKIRNTLKSAQTCKLPFYKE
ncbi:MAG: glycine cleavage T C-terminal barrel domain-containing protein, partial [Bacteroidales bacterium]